MEFLMPYIFLSDIPINEPNRFPNQILSAQLGRFLMQFKPDVNDIVTMYLKNPQLLSNPDEKISKEAKEIAEILSNSRLDDTIKNISNFDETTNQTTIKELSKVVKEILEIKKNENTKIEKLNSSIDKLKNELEFEKNKTNQLLNKESKLKKTLHYWKSVKKK